MAAGKHVEAEKEQELVPDDGEKDRPAAQQIHQEQDLHP